MYKMSEHKYSPARVQECKQILREKINRDLQSYFKCGDQESRRQQILQLLVFKYNQACLNKRLIQSNDEFLTMSKIIAANYPKAGVQKLIKLQSFEKDLRVDEVKLMQLGSGYTNNVMYLSIGEKIYKYDMVTKEQIFEFRTFYQKNGLRGNVRNSQIKQDKKSQQHMVLYDNDTKLMISDSEGQIKLWDSSENKDEIPQLVT